MGVTNTILDWKNNLKQNIFNLKELYPQLNLQEVSRLITELKNHVIHDDPRQILSKIGESHQQPGKKTLKFEQAQWNALVQCKRQTQLIDRFSCLKANYKTLEGLPHLPNEDDLSRIIQSIDSEQKLYPLIELDVLIKRNPQALGISTWQELESEVEQLTSADLTHLNDREDALRPLIEQSLNADPQHNTPLPPQITQRFLDGIHKRIHSFASQTKTKPVVARDPIRLTQVLPQLGIFRGCTGGDCSSQFSFPYPNDPHEMVFFIEDLDAPTRPAPEVPDGNDSTTTQASKSDELPSKDRKLKGYVSATVVDLPNHKKGLYVITISGQRVNAKDTELILRGLEHRKKELGVDHIILPAQSRINDLINFPEIKGIYDSHTQGREEIPIQYQNLELRKEIETFKPSSGYNRGKYDHSEQNRTGVVLKFNDKNTQFPVVDLTQHEDLKLTHTDLNQYSKSEIIELLLDLHHSGRMNLIQRILAIPGIKINENELNSLFRSLEKGHPVSVAEYREIINKNLLALGIPHLLEKKPYFIYPGILNCTDFYSKENIENAARLISKDIKDHDFNPVYFNFRAVDEHTLNQLNQTTAFKNLLGELLKKLSHQDPEIRKSAVSIIGSLKTKDIHAHQILIESLKDTDEEVRRQIIIALGQCSPLTDQVLKLLIQLLENPDPILRRSGAEALGAAKTNNPEILAALIKTSSDKDWAVRRNSVRAIGKLVPQDLQVNRTLIKALSDPEYEVRASAVYALEKIKPKDLETQQLLVQILRTDPDKWVRRNVLDALKEINPDDVELHREISKSLLDPESIVRNGAAYILGKLKTQDPTVLEMVFTAATSPDLRIRITASVALRTIQPQDPHFLLKFVELLKSPDSSLRDLAVEILSTISNQEPIIVSALINLLTHENQEIQTEVINILSKIAPKNSEYLRFICKTLRSPSDHLADRAAQSLIEIKPDDPGTTLDLLKMLKDPSLLVRVRVASVLEEIYRVKLKPIQYTQVEQCLEKSIQSPISEKKLQDLLNLIENIPSENTSSI
jgi:HEAT repeat protein